MKLFGGDTEHLTELGEDFGKCWRGRPGDWAATGL